MPSVECFFTDRSPQQQQQPGGGGALRPSCNCQGSNDHILAPSLGTANLLAAGW